LKEGDPLSPYSFSQFRLRRCPAFFCSLDFPFSRQKKFRLSLRRLMSGVSLSFFRPAPFFAIHDEITSTSPYERQLWTFFFSSCIPCRRQEPLSLLSSLRLLAGNSYTRQLHLLLRRAKMAVIERPFLQPIIFFQS